MAGLGNRRTRTDPDVEINMVPIMNMFLVLIPFLLMSSSFLHLKAIDTSVPVRAVPDTAQQEEEKKSDIVVTAVVKLTYKGINISVTSDELSEAQLAALDNRIDWQEDDELMMTKLSAILKGIKAEYPKSNTLILSPAEDVIYEDIVSVMDAARRDGKDTLFPIVVVSGEVSAS